MKLLVVVTTLSLGLVGDVYAANIRGAIRDGLKDLNAKKGDTQHSQIHHEQIPLTNGRELHMDRKSYLLQGRRHASTFRCYTREKEPVC